LNNVDNNERNIEMLINGLTEENIAVKGKPYVMLENQPWKVKVDVPYPTHLWIFDYKSETIMIVFVFAQQACIHNHNRYVRKWL
jgi:hypothetical protein